MSLVRRAQYPVLSTSRQERADKWSGVEGNLTLARTLTVPYDPSTSGWLAYVPAEGTALSSPSLSYLTFDDFDLAEDATCAGRARLTLRYAQTADNPSAGPVTLPADECIQSSTVEEISIQAHPEFDTANPAWGDHSASEFWDPAIGAFPITFPAFLPDGTTPHPQAGEPFELDDGETTPDDLKGLTTYIVGSGQVRCIEYTFSEPSGWIPETGLRAKPPGTWPGALANWLILSGDIAPQNNGAYYAKTLIYQYSAKEFPGWFYDDA